MCTTQIDWAVASKLPELDIEWSTTTGRPIAVARRVGTVSPAVAPTWAAKLRSELLDDRRLSPLVLSSLFLPKLASQLQLGIKALHASFEHLQCSPFMAFCFAEHCSLIHGVTRNTIHGFIILDTTCVAGHFLRYGERYDTQLTTGAVVLARAMTDFDHVSSQQRATPLMALAFTADPSREPLSTSNGGVNV